MDREVEGHRSHAAGAAKQPRRGCVVSARGAGLGVFFIVAAPAQHPKTKKHHVHRKHASIYRGYVLYLTYRTVLEGGSTADVYKAVETPLKWSQTAALMEVVHAMVGLVRSPVGITGERFFFARLVAGGWLGGDGWWWCLVQPCLVQCAAFLGRGHAEQRCWRAGLADACLGPFSPYLSPNPPQPSHLPQQQQHNAHTRMHSVYPYY